mgnify:CR=1 FL=1
MLHYDFNTIKFSPYTSVIMSPNPYAHTTDFWKITYAIEGKSEQVTDGIKRTLTQHTVLIVKPDAIHQNLNFSGPTYKHRDIYVSDEKMWEICSHFPSGTYNKLCKTTPFFRFSPISFNYLETMLNSFPVNSEIKKRLSRRNTFHDSRQRYCFVFGMFCKQLQQTRMDNKSRKPHQRCGISSKHRGAPYLGYPVQPRLHLQRI